MGQAPAVQGPPEVPAIQPGQVYIFPGPAEGSVSGHSQGNSIISIFKIHFN